MNKVINYVKDKWFYIVAFYFPLIVLTTHSAIADTWVTGGGSFLRGDTSFWTVPFYYELWDIVHQGESLIYGWDMSGGYDVWLHILNCAMSPFTVLILISPRTWIINWVHIMMFLHCAGAAATMTYFFYNTKHNTLQKNKKLVSLFLGLAFALSNAMINFLGYVQWGMTMMIFPLLLLLLERLVENGKWRLYYILLAIAIICNFYISFHICLFLILWFFANVERGTSKKCKKFFVFAGSSVLAAITAMFVILPSFMISGGRYDVRNIVNTIGFCQTILVDLVGMVEQHFIMVPISIPSQLRPNIYCSIIIVMVAAFFVFIKIGTKKKIYYSFVYILLTLSLCFGFLNIIWHCFTVPNLFFHRFVNIYVFWILFMGLYVFINLENLKKWNVFLVTVVLVLAVIITFFNINEYHDFYVYLVSFLLLVFYCMMFVFYVRKSITYKNIVVLFCVLGIVELGINTHFALDVYDIESFYDNTEVSANVALSKYIEMEEGERISTKGHLENIGMVIDENAISGFSSYKDPNNMNLLRKLGMSANGNVEGNLKGASPLVNLIYNLRYYISQYDGAVSDADIVAENKDFNLYKTRRLAGLGYMINSGILDWDLSTDMVFEIQNQFVKKAVGTEPIFEYILPELKITNAFGVEKNAVEEYIDYGIYMVPYDETDYTVATEYVVDKNMDLYILINGSDNAREYVQVNDEIVYVDEKVSVQQTVHVGNVEEGDVVSIFIRLDKGSGSKNSYFLLQFAEFNEENYAAAYEKLSRDVYELEVMDGHYVSGTIDVTEDGIMATSIQAVDGFEVFVDGVQVEYETIGNALIGVPLTKGTHKVEFKYHTPYAKLGWIISGCGFLLFVILCIVGRKKDVSVLCESE